MQVGHNIQKRMTERKQARLELSGVFIYAFTVTIRMFQVKDCHNSHILLLRPDDEIAQYSSLVDCTNT